MKKYSLIKSLALLLMVTTFSSCDSILDQDEVDFGQGPVLAQFVNKSKTANFIKDGEVQTYAVPLTIIGGENQPLSEPVTVTISVDPSSTAVSGTEFTLENSTLTIPAGEMMVDVVVSVKTANLDPFNAKTLVLKIDSSSKSVSESNKSSILLQAVCTFDINTFVGTYNSTSSGVTKTSIVTLGALPNSLKITTGTEKYYIVLNSDPTVPTITYVPQGALHSVNGGRDVWATTITPESSTYNSCNNKMTLEFKRCIAAGCFSGTRTNVMVKQ